MWYVDEHEDKINAIIKNHGWNVKVATMGGWKEDFPISKYNGAVTATIRLEYDEDGAYEYDSGYWFITGITGNWFEGDLTELLSDIISLWDDIIDALLRTNGQM